MIIANVSVLDFLNNIVINAPNILTCIAAVIAAVGGWKAAGNSKINERILNETSIKVDAGNDKIDIGNQKTDDLASSVEQKLTEKTLQLKELNSTLSQIRTENGDLRTENATLKAKLDSVLHEIEALRVEMSTRERVHTETAQLLTACQAGKTQ